MMVKTEYQGKGIGKKLVRNILGLADNWLMIVRVELEGTKKYSIIEGGNYADLIMMASYNIPLSLSKNEFIR